MKEPNYYIPERGFTIPVGEEGFTIYYYAIMIVLGVILATAVVYFLFKRRNIPGDWTIDLLLCILPIGIVGARTFYCLTDPDVGMRNWLHFRDGGLSILGGVIGGALGVILFCVIHKINFLRVADCLVPGVILAQGIGRWGNFFNQEVYGDAVITDPKWQWFPLNVYIESVGEWHPAFFFYESLLNVAIFAGLFLLMWKFLKKPNGLSFAGYLFGYGTVRSVMEPLRDKEYILWNNISQIVAILMAVGGVVLFVTLILLNYKKHGSLFGAKDGEPLAVLPKLYSAEERKKMEETRRRAERAAENAAGKEDPPEQGKGG